MEGKDMETGSAPRTYQVPTWLRFILGKNPGFTVLRILVVVFVTLFVFKFILLPIRVTGHSMWPTFHNGEIKFVNRLAYVREKPKRGDVVAVEYTGAEVLLKRIIALPGEVFQVVDGEVYIDGDPLVEPYAFGKIPDPDPDRPWQQGRPGTSIPVKIEADQYLLWGDNRPDSDGFLKFENQIIGRLF